MKNLSDIPHWSQPDPITWAEPRETNERLYNELVEVVKSKLKPCICFVGAGISKYSWSQLAEDVSTKVRPELPFEKEKAKASETYYMEFFETAKRYHFDVLKEHLKERFDPDAYDDYRLIHKHLINIPFCSYITTNIDSYLVNAIKHYNQENESMKEIYYYPDNLPANKLEKGDLFHIHGICYNHKGDYFGDETVLSLTDYKTAYAKGGVVSTFLSSAFRNLHTVFIGFSLNDCFVKKVLQKVYSEPGTFCGRISTIRNIPKHYVLLGGNGAESDEENRKYYKTLNVHPIYYYRNRKNSHKELESIIWDLFVKTKGVQNE